MSGICVDSENEGGSPTAAELRAAGADGVRLVARDSWKFLGYAQEMQDNDLTVAVVLARESFPNDDFGGFAAYYSERVWPRFVLFGNEPDALWLPVESPSSWGMTIPDYADFWHQAASAWRARQPTAEISIAGLVSGQPKWLEEVLPLLDPAPDLCTVHPYGRDAESARELLRAYAAVWDEFFA